MLDTSRPTRGRVFRGPQSLDVDIDRPGTLAPPERIPSGFDAVVQFDAKLLGRQLLANLQVGGALNLSARVPFTQGGFPEAVGQAAAQHIRPLDSARTLETNIEIRLGAPQVRSLASPDDPVLPGDLVLNPEFTAAAAPRMSAASEEQRPVEIEWLLELNLLRLFLDPGTLSPTAGTGGATSGGSAGGGGLFGEIVGGIGDLSVATADTVGGPTSPPGTREVRNTLATGRVVTRMPSYVVVRDDVLQVWVELDVAQMQATIESNGSPLTELLAVQRGEDMLRSALALLTSRSGLRLTPRVSIAGSASPAQIATLGLTPVHAKEIVRRVPDGREVLSLCLNFGGDVGSPATQVQPFLGSSQFGYFISVRSLAPVLKLRWRMRPASREYIGDVPVEMPLEEGSSETGEGQARLRVRLGGDLRLVSLMAVESLQDDVLRLICDQEIQLLQLWMPDGQEVEDLGELGKPATLPFAANNQLFAKPGPDEETDTPFRNFLKFVLEPLARPLVEPFEIAGVSGIASEALGAIVVRWSLPIRVKGGLGASGALPDLSAGIAIG